MATQAITLHLPDDIYERVRRQAELTHRSIEEAASELVVSAIEPEVVSAIEPEMELPADLQELLAQLAFLDDAALWQAARSRVPVGDSQRLEALHHKRQRTRLTESELQKEEQLVHEYERVMLVRAEAAVLLKQRGHDISALVTKQ